MNYYISSDEESNAGRILDGATASNLFLCTKALSFEEYVLNNHQRVYEVDFKQDWTMSTCSCPQFMSTLFCKHVLAIALLKRFVSCPADANPSVLGQKPKRGRKPNAKGALFKPNS